MKFPKNVHCAQQCVLRMMPLMTHHSFKKVLPLHSTAHLEDVLSVAFRLKTKGADTVQTCKQLICSGERCVEQE